MGDITGLLPISPLQSKSNESQKVYRAHDTLRPFMTELVSLSDSQYSSHTLGKWIVGG